MQLKKKLMKTNFFINVKEMRKKISESKLALKKSTTENREKMSHRGRSKGEGRGEDILGNGKGRNTQPKVARY